ncbi:MAG TPA: amidohydrolase [Terriglobia bacterium]|nr:amidohydrolase [Terriglobia bacterium]
MRWSLTFLGFCFSSSFLLAQGQADLILTKAKFWTAAASLPSVEALAIKGNRIAAVGSEADVLKWRGAQTILLELPGRLVVPGFIDNHTHFLDGGFQLRGVDLRPARNEKDFAERLRQWAETLTAGQWITGGRWDHEAWPVAKLPTKELIDAVTPNTPVYVRRLDGHMGLANSLALRLAGITRSTPNPDGGVIVRDSETGEPTGILKDAAQALVSRLIPSATRKEEDEALRAAMKEAARFGVTSVQDITSWSAFETFRRAQTQNQLTVRITARTPLSAWEKQVESIRKHGAGDDWLRLGGFKAFMDGSLGSTTAYFFEPYRDDPKTAGLLASDAIPESKMLERMLAADKAGLQLSIHAIGDRANHLLLNLFHSVAKTNGPRDRRFRIEHAQHLRREDIPRFAQLGVIPSMQPYHCIDDGRWAEKRIGPDRIKTTYAFRSLLDHGARLTFGSDWTVAPINPLLGVYAAVTRRTLDDRNPHGWVPEEKITVEEAMKSYTIANAYASFDELKKGSLDTGKLADIVVLDRDIFTIPPVQIPQAVVLYTIVGGKIVYRGTPRSPN